MRWLALPVALLLVASVHAAPSTPPNAEDPDGDAGHASLDFQKLWLTVNSTHLFVTLQVAELPELPSTSPCTEEGCASATLSYRAEFRVERPNGDSAPALANYNRTYVVYRHGADEPTLRTQVGWFDGAGALTFDGNPEVTVEGNAITFALPRSHEAVNIPAGPTPGAYRVIMAYGYDSPQACQGIDPELPVACQSALKPVVTSAGLVLDAEWDRIPDADYATPLVLPNPAPAPPPPPETTSTTASPTTEAPSTTAEPPTTQASTSQSPTTAPSTLGSSSAPTAKSPGAPLALVMLALAVAVQSVKRRTTSSSKASRCDSASSMR